MPKLMNLQRITLFTVASVTSLALLSSCAAGRVDRVEDRVDRTEDRYDRRHYSGPGDHLESRIDRAENVNDKLRGRRAILH